MYCTLCYSEKTDDTSETRAFKAFEGPAFSAAVGVPVAPVGALATEVVAAAAPSQVAVVLAQGNAQGYVRGVSSHREYAKLSPTPGRRGDEPMAKGPIEKGLHE